MLILDNKKATQSEWLECLKWRERRDLKAWLKVKWVQ